MKMPIFQVDAFTDEVFRGNPAAVCPLPKWPQDVLLQSIAAENNLPETAFLVGAEGKYKLRWFTPVQEIDLCGHATLAAAYVVMTAMEKGQKHVAFSTKSGTLRVSKVGRDLFAMDFPARPAERVDPPPAALLEALGKEPLEVWAARDYMAVYATEKDVKALRPNMEKLRQLDKLGVIVTQGRQGGLRVPLLRAQGRRPGGSGHRLLPLHAHPLLGRAPGQGRSAGPPGVAPRRRPHVHAPRQTRGHRRPGRAVHERRGGRALQLRSVANLAITPQAEESEATGSARRGATGGVARRAQGGWDDREAVAPLNCRRWDSNPHGP